MSSTIQRLELLVKESLSHARAGADIIAPSDMMDGRDWCYPRMRWTRTDTKAYSDLWHIPQSMRPPFYGPFRDAAESTPQFGDRRSYQMDAPNVEEALREVELDIAEGSGYS